MSMSKGRGAATIVLSILLVALLLFRLLFLFISMRFRSYFRSRKFYRAMRKTGLDSSTARRLLMLYREHNTLSLRKLASMAFKGRRFPFSLGNHKTY